MEILYSIGDYAIFALGVASAIAAGIKLLPLAELLFTDDLPEDGTAEA